MASSSSAWQRTSRRRLEDDADTVGLVALAGRDVREHICMILGRPTLWLLLTYDGSNDTIWPGFSRVQEEGLDSFKFLRIFGRAARRQPQCEMREAVGHGWRESILPFVCQGRLESDVLCVILEEDWRPWQTSGNEEADPRNQDVRCCHGVIRSMVGLYNVAAQQDADCGLIWYSWEGKEGKKGFPSMVSWL